MFLRAIWTGDGLKRMTRAAGKIADPTTKRQMHRAVARTGRDVQRQVVAATARQSGLSVQSAVQKGTIRGVSTGGGSEYLIDASGYWLSLSEFNPVQTDEGVVASPWGRPQLFPGAFMGPRPGVIAEKLGGEVFHRILTQRLPIEKLWGPNVAREMVRDKPPVVFVRQVSRLLPRRVLRVIQSASAGALSKS